MGHFFWALHTSYNLIIVVIVLLVINALQLQARCIVTSKSKQINIELAAFKLTALWIAFTITLTNLKLPRHLHP
jgi:hypothetical protein